jgi:hypothetical protein
LKELHLVASPLIRARCYGTRKSKEDYILFGIGFILTHSSCYTERRNIKREGKGAAPIPVTN